jgi:hypothetical protein
MSDMNNTPPIENCLMHCDIFPGLNINHNLTEKETLCLYLSTQYSYKR